MRLFRFIFCWMILLPGMVQGQYSNKVWCFGENAGVIFSNPVSYFTTNESSVSASVSIANSQDSLLFYGTSAHPTAYNNGWGKNGQLRNKNHLVMQNGDSLICLGWYHDILIVPKSVNDSTFYVFNAGVSGPYFGLYYSIVDLKLNSGLGAVTLKNVQLDTTATKDALMAVKHGNGKDWWLVTRRWDYYNVSADNEFYVYLVDSNGISPLPVQSIGSLRTTGGGDITFNADGTKMAVCDWRNLIELYDFDRCSGLISNPVNIEIPSTVGPFNFYISTAFSGTSEFLYVMSIIATNEAKIFQYNLQAMNISATKTLVATISDSASCAMMKLAPNGSIYISTWTYKTGSSYPYSAGFYNTVNSNLSVINTPDSAGTACNFQLFSFPLGGNRTYRGLPHNPNYEMGRLVGSPCDTLTVGIAENSVKEEVFFQAWYNHEWNMIHVNAAQLKGKKGVLRLFDMEGRIVFEKPAEVIAGGYFTTEINMSGLANGVYMVNLVTEQEKISGKVGPFD
jgi:hypothetical protein